MFIFKLFFYFLLWLLFLRFYFNSSIVLFLLLLFSLILSVSYNSLFWFNTFVYFVYFPSLLLLHSIHFFPHYFHPASLAATWPPRYPTSHFTCPSSPLPYTVLIFSSSNLFIFIFNFYSLFYLYFYLFSFIVTFSSSSVTYSTYVFFQLS